MVGLGRPRAYPSDTRRQGCLRPRCAAPAAPLTAGPGRTDGGAQPARASPAPPLARPPGSGPIWREWGTFESPGDSGLPHSCRHAALPCGVAALAPCPCNVGLPPCQGWTYGGQLRRGSAARAKRRQLAAPAGAKTRSRPVHAMSACRHAKAGPTEGNCGAAARRERSDGSLLPPPERRRARATKRSEPLIAWGQRGALVVIGAPSEVRRDNSNPAPQPVKGESRRILRSVPWTGTKVPAREPCRASQGGARVRP